MGSQIIFDPAESTDYTPGTTKIYDTGGPLAYFSNSTADGEEPWVTDGTSTGTELFRANVGSHAGIYAQADNGESGNGLYRLTRTP